MIINVFSHLFYVCFRYTSGDVKVWNMEDDTSCRFQPSSTALLRPDDRDDDLDDPADPGGGVRVRAGYPDPGAGITNHPHQVLTAGSMTVAAFTHGNQQARPSLLSLRADILN